MAVLPFLVLLLALTRCSNASYCLCKDGVSDAVLQKALDYACGNGADCGPILQTGACYSPNTLKDHCSYAANSYYQQKAGAGATCDFVGAATLSSSPPTNAASGCTYPSSSGTSTSTSGTTSPSAGVTPSTPTSNVTSSFPGVAPSANMGISSLSPRSLPWRGDLIVISIAIWFLSLTGWRC